MNSYKVNDKIFFEGEKKPYKIKACDNRFLICTKPYNLGNTVIYTIVDLQQQIRGTENLMFCHGFETKEQCEEALERLQAGKSEISRSNWVKLNIVLTK